MTRRSALVNVMARAADRAGRALIRDFGEVEQLQVSRKGPSDFVTNADIKAERIVRQELERGRPGYSFLMEESGLREGDDKQHCWIVDPLDGTLNFMHGLPHFCISIGLTRDDEPIAGVIYDPIKDELFWAEKNLGAYLNNRRIRVSGRRQLAETVLATGIPFGIHRDTAVNDIFLRQLESVMDRIAGVRRFGSAALDLAYVAAGRYDGFWENGLKPWDVAAGVVIIREAGGFVTEINGRRYELGAADILVANDLLHEPLVNIFSA
jgi:myo-inositol-1(or 4)-monophosphatase